MTKKGFQTRTNAVKDEKVLFVADSHINLARSRNCSSQLLKVHGVKDVRQTLIHAAEILVPEPSSSEFELAIKNL